jgi:hypothetical protein
MELPLEEPALPPPIFFFAATRFGLGVGGAIIGTVRGPGNHHCILDGDRGEGKGMPPTPGWGLPPCSAQLVTHSSEPANMYHIGDRETLNMDRRRVP